MALAWKRGGQDAAGVHALSARPHDDILVTVYPLPVGSPVTAETKHWETCVRWRYLPLAFHVYDAEQDAMDDAQRLTVAALDALVVQLAEAREEVTR